MARFELVIIKPVKGKPGTPLCTLFKHADSVSEAIKEVRTETSAMVLQAADFRRSVFEYNERLIKEAAEAAKAMLVEATLVAEVA
jgi:glutaredoxin-related protein